MFLIAVTQDGSLLHFSKRQDTSSPKKIEAYDQNRGAPKHISCCARLFAAVSVTGETQILGADVRDVWQRHFYGVDIPRCLRSIAFHNNRHVLAVTKENRLFATCPQLQKSAADEFNRTGALAASVHCCIDGCVIVVSANKSKTAFVIREGDEIGDDIYIARLEPLGCGLSRTFGLGYDGLFIFLSEKRKLMAFGMREFWLHSEVKQNPFMITALAEDIEWGDQPGLIRLGRIGARPVKAAFVYDCQLFLI